MMPNPLHASHYPDAALHQRVNIVENVRIAQATYRLRFACPELAARILPGQFLMLRLERNDPLIGRAFALYQTVLSETGEPWGIDVVYLVKGKFTRELVKCPPGQSLMVWGPLGNGFPADPIEHLILVAGGIGQTPFLSLAAEFLGQRRYGQPARTVPPAQRVTLCYGARTADLLAGVEDFQALGVDLHLATDDGTRGRHGVVLDVLRPLLERPELPLRTVACGPEVMLQAVAELTAQWGAPCQVSLETPMACGIGICFSCVTRVQDDRGDWDWKRTCVEGPVFDAERIAW